MMKNHLILYVLFQYNKYYYQKLNDDEKDDFIKLKKEDNVRDLIVDAFKKEAL